MSANIFIGTSSFSSKDWVGPFYPPGTKPADFLSYYTQKFDTVEIDSTYYAVPSAKTILGWKEKTPDNFIFTAKFPRSIVHGGEDSVPSSVNVLMPDAVYNIRDDFLGKMSLLEGKLGPLLIQFPYFNKNVFSSKALFYERLDRFLEDLPTEFRYAVEIRNRYWLSEEFTSILKRHNIALALTDHSYMPMPHEIAENIDPITTDFSYIRLLGDRKKIEDITTTWDREVIDKSESLTKIASFLARLDRENILSYTYINNHYAGHAPETLRKLRVFLDRMIEAGD